MNWASREDRLAYFREWRKKNGEKERAKDRAEYAARRAAGQCVQCGVPVPTNPFTRRPYRLCLPHYARYREVAPRPEGA